MSGPGWLWSAGAMALFALAMLFVPFIAMAYGPWLAWLGMGIWLGWRVPALIATTDKPLRDAGRRFAMGAVVITLASLPVVYAIATLQATAFGGEGFQWAAPQVLLATVLLLAPMVYVPLLAVRCGQMYGRARRGGAVDAG